MTRKFFGLALVAVAFIGCMFGTPALSAQPFGPPTDGVLGFAAVGMLINRANLQAMFTGFNTTFNNAFAAAQSDWNQVAMEVPSSHQSETYGWLGTTKRFREWLGDRVIQNLKLFDYSIKNKPYENTIGVDRDQIEDDSYGIYSPMIANLGNDAKTHPDELVFALLAAGFATTCYDGQYFFDTDHPVLQADGTYVSVSNTGGGAGAAWYLLDTSKPVKPLIFQKRRDYKFVAMDQDSDEAAFSRKEYRYGVDARANVGYGLWQIAYGSKQALDAAAYAAARTALLNMKGDNGKPLGVRPSLLVCGPSNEGAGLTVLQAEKNANGSTNIYRNTAKLLVTPWL